MRNGILGLMAAVTTTGLMASHQANAQAVAYITTSGGAIFGPESSPGGNWSLTALGTGQYQVMFYGLGNGMDSTVQANAILTDHPSGYCISAGWSSANGTDVTVDVDCFDGAGAAQDTDFAVLYQVRTSAPASGQLAFLWADQPSATSPYAASASYSFNSAAGVNTVTHLATGSYNAFLPGLTKNGGDVQVTAYGSSAAHCQVTNWSSGGTGTNVAVYCVDAAGNAADEYFDLSYVNGAAQGVGTSTALGGYAWANNPSGTGSYVPSKSYQYNNVSTKRLTAENSETYADISMLVPSTVTLSGVIGMVTAYGADGNYCEPDGLGYYGTTRKDDLILTVACFTPQGTPVNTKFTATLLAGPGRTDNVRR